METAAGEVGGENPGQRLCPDISTAVTKCDFIIPASSWTETTCSILYTDGYNTWTDRHTNGQTG